MQCTPNLNENCPGLLGVAAFGRAACQGLRSCLIFCCLCGCLFFISYPAPSPFPRCPACGAPTRSPPCGRASGCGTSASVTKLMELMSGRDGGEEKLQLSRAQCCQVIEDLRCQFLIFGGIYRLNFGGETHFGKSLTNSDQACIIWKGGVSDVA